MSILIRHITNGKKAIYLIRNAGVTPTQFFAVDEIRKIPEDIRHLAPKDKPSFVGPDVAHIIGAAKYLYPNFPKCQHPGFIGARCIAESCRYAVPDYQHCPYFDKTYQF